MGIEDAFLHDILTHPDDDAPRLIYADWLDEHSDPRGGFIRVQCALAQFSEEDPRRWPLEQCEQELLREHQTKWLPKDVSALSFCFRRGFVERVEMTSEQFLATADRLFEQAPIRHLRLAGAQQTGHVPVTAAGRHPSLERVASSRHLARLQGLTLTDYTLNQHALEAFLLSPYLRQLTELHLSPLPMSIGREFFRMDLKEYTRLKCLDLSHNSFHPGMVRALTELLSLEELTSLNLAYTSLDLDGLRVLADSSSLASLRELNLNGNRLTHQAATILAEGRLLSQLEKLHLDSNLLGDAGALTIRDWPALPRLSRLSLGHNQIFPAGAKALAQAPALRGLVSLDLFGNISCDDGAVALASVHWKRLQSLHLRFNGVGDKGVRALARSESLSQLTRLNLIANRITSEGARALIASPGLSRLARLDLLRNDVAAEEQQKLRERFGSFVYF